MAMCFRDRSFCSAAEHCANRDGCDRYLDPEQRERARIWWGDGPGEPPIAYMDFSDHCPQYKDTRNDGKQ